MRASDRILLRRTMSLPEGILTLRPLGKYFIVHGSYPTLSLAVGPCEKVGRNLSPISLSGMDVTAEITQFEIVSSKQKQYDVTYSSV